MVYIFVFFLILWPLPISTRTDVLFSYTTRLLSFFASDFGTPDGRRAPFSAACLLIKVVRIMLRATGSVSSLAKYLLSTDSALSNGNCAPSKIVDNIARGAGRL